MGTLCAFRSLSDCRWHAIEEKPVVSRVLSRQNLKAFLLRQRDQVFARPVEMPTVERRAHPGRQRSLIDRRSSTEPNRSAYSRRVSIVDRRKIPCGRRKTDLLGSA